MKNNRTCRASASTDALLLYAASKSVNWFTLKTKHMKRVADNLNQVIGISYDGEHVYWTDISVQVESIMRATTDGSDIEVRFLFLFLKKVTFNQCSILHTDCVHSWLRKT